MMEPDKIMESVSKELESTFEAMKKAKTPDEKLTYSKTIKNLCESLGVFLDLITAMSPYDDYDDDDYDDEDDGKVIPF